MKISESFYSVQAEGITTGTPAYFIRLARCNLSCGFSKDAITKLTKDLSESPDQTGTSDIDRKYADLYEQGKSSWFCDTASVWVNGIEVSNEELKERFDQTGHLDWITSGKVHLIWTGGEPTMVHHQKAIAEFLKFMRNKYHVILFSEIETNGTIVTDPFFYRKYIQQINCSPKLRNSGMPENKRIVPDAIRQIMRHPEYQFKFVISNEEDILEIQKDWIDRFHIPDYNVILMPGVASQDDIFERTKFLYEMTKKYGYRGITRGHVVAWGKVTGV